MDTGPQLPVSLHSLLNDVIILTYLFCVDKNNVDTTWGKNDHQTSLGNVCVLWRCWFLGTVPDTVLAPGTVLRKWASLFVYSMKSYILLLFVLIIGAGHLLHATVREMLAGNVPTDQFIVELGCKNTVFSQISLKVNSILSGGRLGADSAVWADNGVINSEPVGHWILSCEYREGESRRGGGGNEGCYLGLCLTVLPLCVFTPAGSTHQQY